MLLALLLRLVIDATIIRSFLCEGREIPARNGFCLSKREKFFYFFPLYLYIFLSTCSIVKLRVFPEFLYGRESALTQIITVTNQKGGVGKTTTASALVCGLSQRGAKVLGIDLDPQGNLGFTLGADIDSGGTIFDVLKGTCPIESAIIATEYGDVLPSDIMLSAAELEFTAPRREFLLDQQLSQVRSRYDFIIIDTPPALNVLTVNAYVVSDALIVPMEAEVLSLVGITQLQETIETVRASFNHRLKVLGILLNKFNPRLTLSREILDLAEEVARQLGTQVFRFKVHRSVGVAMAPAHGQTVLTYQPKSKSAQDLQALVDVVGGERFPGPKKSGLSFWS